MHMFWGDWLTDGNQAVDTNTSLTSVIITNHNVTARSIYIPERGVYYNHWLHNEYTEEDRKAKNIKLIMSGPTEDTKAELKERYWAASFLLPLGSIFILAVIILLMVLFKRCPHMVAAVVAGILGTIIVFVILVSVNHTPIYY